MIPDTVNPSAARTLTTWTIWANRGNDRVALELTLSRKALKAAIGLMRDKGYKSIFPQKP